MKLTVIDDWKCQGSGDCCRHPTLVSMTYAERRELEAYAGLASRRLQWRYNAKPNMTNLVAGPCPFVTPENRCGVYDVRPFQCRRYGCMRADLSEPFRGEDTGTILDRMPEAFNALSKLQSDGQVWALAHGWKETQQ